MSGVDIAGLVERLREVAGLQESNWRRHREVAQRWAVEAADALLAQAAELAEAREHHAFATIGWEKERGLRDEALAALKASEEREAGLREALSRQTDNMAFILNHAAVLPDHWFEKFDRELTEDRVPLAGSRTPLVGTLADATNNAPSDPGMEQREAGNAR